MNLDTILSSLTEPTSGEATSRRESILKTAGLARKAVLALVPLGLGAFAFPARAAVNSADALNLMLEIKLMLKALYEEGAAANFASGSAQGAISAADAKKIITELQPKTDAHISELSDAITNMGGTPVSKQFSLTGNPSGSLGTVFTDRRVFMALAQVLHDVSSRGIKGLMPELESSGENLMTGMKLQAADARYATLWNIARGTASTQFFPSENSDYTNLPQELVDYGNSKGVNIAQTVYQGENNTNQIGTDVTSVTSADAAFVSGAFDEPLAESEVRKILDLFEV